MEASSTAEDTNSSRFDNEQSNGKDRTKDKESSAKSSKEDNDESANEATGNTGQENESSHLMDLLARHLQGLLGISTEDKETREPVIEEFNISGIAKYIKSDKCKNVIVMTGAGVSTSAGIPDFRSPGSGLYDNLAKYNLPQPQSIFDINYFLENPEPFFMLAKELYPGSYQPTPTHFFIKLLEEKNLLLRNYTQNIDGLEIVAGLSPELVVAAHGSFYSSHCVKCNNEYPEKWMKEKIFKDEIPKCSKCDGVVKPDIVFFGEGLPSRFGELVPLDFAKCDLLIVMGTSLAVYPFASLIDRVDDSTPRLLINKEKCGVGGFFGGFDFDSERKYRDVAYLTTCDEGCIELAQLLGWKDDLDKIIEEGTKQVVEEST